jgi:RHS repeat-associated protein
VSVSGSASGKATLYHDSTWALPGAALPSGSATYTATAQDSYGRQSTNSVTVNFPSSASYSYDLNGNLLGDGNRCFAYNDENELISVWVTNLWRSDFVYDGKMRRRERIEYTWSGGVWLTNGVTFYVYDGNLVIQERDGNNLPKVTYTRGRDLGGTFEGAGGIGGLLARSDNSMSSVQPSAAHAYYHADGNGNITCLINSQQAVMARYLYDPFGSILSQSGSLAGANLYRFSSKEFHVRSGLVYYLYRFYDPNLQRWINREPLGDYVNIRRALVRYAVAGRQPLPFEQWGDTDLYGFAGNDPVLYYDYIGLSWFGNGLAGAVSGAASGALTGGAIGAGIGAFGAGVGAGPGFAAGAGAGAISGAIGGFIGGAFSGSGASMGTALKNGAVCGALAGLPGGAAAVGGTAAGAGAGIISGGYSAGSSSGWNPTTTAVGATFGGLLGSLVGAAEGLPPGYAALVGLDTELGGQVIGETYTLTTGEW